MLSSSASSFFDRGEWNDARGLNFLQDETGASAIMAEQLDAAMGGAPKEFREVQGSESPEFLQVRKSPTISALSEYC